MRCLLIFALTVTVAPLFGAAPAVNPDSTDCAAVAEFMVGNVLTMEYSVTQDDGYCLQVQTFLYFDEDGTASEILSDGTVLSSFAYVLTPSGGQCILSSGTSDCDEQTLVLDGAVVNMTHDGMTATLSASEVEYGCTDPAYAEYDAGVTVDDGSCVTLLGCLWPDACNYNPLAGADDGSCEFSSCAGCRDEAACNYDATATLDGPLGTCIYPIVFQDCSGNCLNDANANGICDEIEAIGVDGCTDAEATNYNPAATNDDGSCYSYTEAGCMVNSATNYDPTVNVQGEPVEAYCIFPWYGASMLPSADCADPSACNYDATATGYTECDYCLGCTDDGACNYDSSALYDDGSCSYVGCSGCTNACSANYDNTAVIDDGSCDYANCGGCTDSEADNYDAGATLDDGSCQYAGCTFPSACNYDPTANVDDGSCSLLDAASLSAVNVVSGATAYGASDAEISVTVDSGNPVALLLDGLNGSADYTFAYPGIYDGIAPGYYSVTVEDGFTCASNAIQVTVSYAICCDCGVSDADTDGICDDTDNCIDKTAPNYADPANTPCITD